jgi:hypothetical protein
MHHSFPVKSKELVYLLLSSVELPVEEWRVGRAW